MTFIQIDILTKSSLKAGSELEKKGVGYEGKVGSKFGWSMMMLKGGWY